jgi:hypothetical protein
VMAARFAFARYRRFTPQRVITNPPVVGTGPRN